MIEAAIIEKKLQIIISDNGIGMPLEMMEKLSIAGIDNPEHDTDFQKSSGIGYYIIHEILKTVQGEISIMPSTENQGTRIIISWPIVK